MQVSVIIPTFNRPEFILEAVGSVLGQSLGCLEVIIVDDGSDLEIRKRTAELGARDFRVRYFERPHLGVSAARNFGVSVASGKYVAFLDSDDLWLPKKLEKQIKFLEEPRLSAAGSESFQVCYTDEKWLRNGQHLNQLKKHQKFGGWIFEKCLPLCIISASSILLERSLFEELGGFDETFEVCEDYELWLRMAQKYPIGYLNEKLIVKRGGHSDQLSKKHWGMDRFRIRALEKLLANDLPPADRSLAGLELEKKRMIFARGAAKRRSKSSTGPI